MHLNCFLCKIRYLDTQKTSKKIIVSISKQSLVSNKNYEFLYVKKIPYFLVFMVSFLQNLIPTIFIGKFLYRLTVIESIGIYLIEGFTLLEAITRVSKNHSNRRTQLIFNEMICYIYYGNSTKFILNKLLDRLSVPKASLISSGSNLQLVGNYFQSIKSSYLSTYSDTAKFLIALTLPMSGLVGMVILSHYLARLEVPELIIYMRIAIEPPLFYSLYIYVFYLYIYDIVLFIFYAMTVFLIIRTPYNLPFLNFSIRYYFSIIFFRKKAFYLGLKKSFIQYLYLSSAQKNYLHDSIIEIAQLDSFCSHKQSVQILLKLNSGIHLYNVLQEFTFLYNEDIDDIINAYSNDPKEKLFSLLKTLDVIQDRKKKLKQGSIILLVYVSLFFLSLWTYNIYSLNTSLDIKNKSKQQSMNIDKN